MTNDLSTLLCLFHSCDHAHAALEDILKAGIPEANVTLIGDTGSTIEASKSSLAELNVPKRDLEHLLDGIHAGGAVLCVSAISADADKVEAIFKDHSAAKIDEETVADDMSASALPLAAAGAGLADEGLDEEDVDDEGLVDHEDAVLVTEELATVETPEGIRVFRVLTVEPLVEGMPPTTVDEDPRELGLDARMMPEPNNQVH